MATALEYFEKAQHLEMGLESRIRIEDDDEIVVQIKIAYDFDSGAKYIRIYIPDTAWPETALFHCISIFDQIWAADKETEIVSGLSGALENISSRYLTFTNRILLWTPAKIEQNRWDAAVKELATMGLSLVVRDADYVALRDKHQQPLAFISHDSRDKPVFVADLAKKLSSSLCPVWYDEYSLKPGDSLRASIEKGLKTCPKCVVVLSPNFFENPGWARREFDMIYTREVIEGSRIMLPVWLGVTKQQVYEYSPILADTVGIDANLGVEEVTRRLLGAINHVPPGLIGS